MKPQSVHPIAPYTSALFQPRFPNPSVPRALSNRGRLWNTEGVGQSSSEGAAPTPAGCAAAAGNGVPAQSTGVAALTAGAKSLTTASSGLTVQIVNDSDRTDEQVFLLLSGTSVAVSGEITSLQLPQSATGSITAGALNGLASDGTLVSPYTGQTRTIYQFGVNTLVSGRLLVSFDDAIVYADNAAPTATNQTMRWDKLEFGYPGSGADLTSIDFFGIPLQFDYLDVNGNVLNTMTYYTSTPTLLSSLYNLQAPAMANAFQQYASQELSFGWTPGTDSLSNFVRVVGPQTLTADNGSAAPYPSFKPYLDALVKAAQSYTISGSAGVGAPAPANNNVSYDYSGSFASDNQNGYTLTLSGSMSGTPYGLYTDSDGVTTAQALPSGLPVTLALPEGAYDDNIYSAQANAFAVGQSTNPSGANYLAPDLVQYTKNSPYATIAGDLIAGLNFGYPDGNYGANSAAWYSNPPTPYPFGAARTSNDGYYNPFAAVLYNLSDAYGFPFSDRNGRPSPYVPLPANATTMRVTILNDNRFDAPQVTLDQINDTTVTLNWPAITVPAGFTLTGFNVMVSPPYPGWADHGPADTTTVTFGALQPGTQYTFSVTAIGSANGQTVQSYTTQVSAVTGGTAAALSGDYTFLTTLNWSAPAPQPADMSITIGGVAYTPGGAPAAINGSAGSNVFPLIVSAGGNPIYQGNYVVNLVADGSGYNVGPSGCALVGNGQPLSQAGPPGTPPYLSAAGSQLVIGTPFAPVAGKEAAPVVFPSQT